MASAPIVLSREQLPGSQQLPQLPSGENLYRAEVGAAQQLEAEESRSAAMIGQVERQSSAAELQFLQSVASGVNGMAQAVLEQQRRTSLTEAKTTYLNGLEKLRTDFENDQDWKTAPDRFAEERKKLADQTFGGFSPSDRAELQQDMVRTDLSAAREVKQRTVTKTNDAALAARDAATPTMLSQASRSGSPEERTSLFEQFDKSEDDLVRSGTQTAQQAIQRKQSFRTTVEQADVMRGIKDRPQETLAALDNPDMFTSLDPTTRQTYRSQAQAALDERRSLEAQDKAKRDPIAATVQYSRNVPAEQIDTIFTRGIVQQESGGNPRAQSYAGAAGLAQVMPGTARGLADAVGRPDLKGMSDSQIQEAMKSDPELSYKLGNTYFRQMLTRFDGHLPVAIGAYHAGPGGVEGAYRRAKEKYGDNFTAEQFASEIPDGINDGKVKTSDYVRQVFARLGADPGRGGVSTNAAYRIGGAIDTLAKQERAENLRNLQALVSNTNDERDAVMTAFKKGFATDPQAIQAVKAPLIAAASAGDAGATQKLRQFGELEQLAPLVREAYQLPPQQLDTAVAGLRQLVAGGRSGAADQRRLNVFEEVAKEVASQASSNPVGLVERSGSAPVTRVDVPQDPGSAQFASQLTARAVTASAAADRYGGALKVLKPEEATALKARFGDAQPDEKARMLTTASAAIGSGRVYDAFVNEVTGSDSLARTAGRLGRTDPAIAADILRGQTLLEQPGVKPKVAEVRSELQTKLPSNVYPAEVQGDLIEAALALYAAEKGKAGTLFDRTDRAGLDRAISRVAGDMVDVNGRKAPVPYGSRQRDLSDGWRRLDDATVIEMGGAYGAGGEKLEPDFLARNAVLRPLAAGGGRYAVFVPQGGQDRPVLTLDGASAIVTLDMLRRNVQRRDAAADRALVAGSRAPGAPDVFTPPGLVDLKPQWGTIPQ